MGDVRRPGRSYRHRPRYGRKTWDRRRVPDAPRPRSPLSVARATTGRLADARLPGSHFASQTWDRRDSNSTSLNSRGRFLSRDARDSRRLAAARRRSCIASRKIQWDRRDSNSGPTHPMRRGYHYPTVPCVRKNVGCGFNLFVSPPTQTSTRSSSTTSPVSASGSPARWPRHTAAPSGV